MRLLRAVGGRLCGPRPARDDAVRRGLGDLELLCQPREREAFVAQLQQQVDLVVSQRGFGV